MIAIKENDYFLAAQAIGCSKGKTFIRHVLPNIVAVVIIIFSVNIGGNILAAAALSFLGYGLPLGTPEWGGLLSQEGRSGKLRRRQEQTQTRLPGPTDQPFQLVSGQKEALPFSLLRITVFSSSSSLGHLEESSPENLFLF